MASDAYVLKNVTEEGALQVIYVTVATVSNNDTTDFSAWGKNILMVDISPSTATAVGSTNSAGVVTWLIGSGSPNLVARVVFSQ